MNNNTKFPSLELYFQEQYGFDKHNIGQLYELLNTSTFEGFYKDNPMNYITSIRAYPFSVIDLFNNSSLARVKIGGVELIGIVSKLEQQKGAINLGSISILRHFNNYLDYAPYTKISVYLPYVGIYSLPTNEVIGQSIEFWYAIDTFTGNVSVYIINANTNKLILIATGKIGIEVSLGGSNAHERLRNNYMTGVQMIGGLTQGGLSVGNIVNQSINASASLIANNVENITRGSISEGFSSLSGPQKIIIYIETPKVVNNNYQTFKGKPLLEDRLISNLSGYTEVEDIHLEGFDNATLQELNEIENLLKNGVIL